VIRRKRAAPAASPPAAPRRHASPSRDGASPGRSRWKDHSWTAHIDATPMRRGRQGISPRPAVCQRDGTPNRPRRCASTRMRLAPEAMHWGGS
jgi:hypothetical protein